MKIDDIINSPHMSSGKSLVRKMRKRFDGRIPHDNIATLYAISKIMGQDCDNYLEIGVLSGGSMALMVHNNDVHRRHVGVDLFEGYDISLERSLSNINMFNHYDHEVKLIKGDSNQSKVIRQVSDLFPDGVSLLFIDGDHSYDGVKNDFESYGPLVRPGGIICFDDYDGSGYHRSNIKRYVDQISEDRMIRVGKVPIKNSSIFVMEVR